jgi:excisionase family DNA binding protein
MDIIVTTKAELSDLIQSSIRSVLNDKQPKNGHTYDSSDYLSIDEASEYLRVPISTLYQYCSSRRIPFLKRGKRNYFLKSDLDLWMSSDRKKTITEIQNESKKKGDKR